MAPPPGRPTIAGERGARRDARLTLLRGFDLWLGEERVPVPETAQRVVAFLALQERPVTRLQVGGTLWPETSDDRAAASLRTALWRVRMLGAPLIRVDGPRLALLTHVTVDVRDMVSAARRLMAPAACVADEELDGMVLR